MSDLLLLILIPPFRWFIFTICVFILICLVYGLYKQILKCNQEFLGSISNYISHAIHILCNWFRESFQFQKMASILWSIQWISHVQRDRHTSCWIYQLSQLFSTFCLLDASVNLSKSSSTHPSIPSNRSNTSCMHFIYFWVLHFFIPSMSIASCCHVLVVGLWFLVLLIPSMSVLCLSSVNFLAFYAIWQSCQKGGEIWDLNVIP